MRIQRPIEIGAESLANSTGRGTVPADSESQLDLNSVFETLKNERRRLVLRHLREEGRTVSIGELSEAVAALENDKAVDEISSTERKRAYVGLYQCHLPKMDSMGVIEFEPSRSRVELGEHAEEIFPYLDMADEVKPESRLVMRDVALSLMGFLVFGLVVVVEMVTELRLALPALGMVVVAFAVLTVAHHRETTGK